MKSSLKVTFYALAGLALLYFLIIFAINPKVEKWDWKSINLDEAAKVSENFIWGTASAAYQVEGHHSENDNWGWWETQVDKNGNPRVEGKAGTGNDEWNLYAEDIKNMQFLGVDSYRFSVSWSKIMPNENEFDEAVLAHYDNLINALIDAKIIPMISLHHFTHPMWFERKGAFDKEENIKYFVEFSKKVFARYGDRVKYFITFNEPVVYGYGRHITDTHPNPYGDTDFQRLGIMLKNTLIAHDQVYAAIKSMPEGARAKVGLSKSMMQMDPYSKYDLGDQIVAYYAQKIFADAYVNYFSKGVFDFQAFVVGANVVYKNPDAKNIKLDFIGMNYYSHNAFDFSYLDFDLDKAAMPLVYPGEIPTDLDYGYYPEGLYRAIKDISIIGKPIYITENGIGIGEDQEDLRQHHLKTAVYGLSKAIAEGYDVRSYYYWSLNDNFEWNFAYNKAFGLYKVARDTPIPTRTPKATALLYKDIIKKSKKVSK